MQESSNQSSGVNTVLLVIVIVALVAGGIWFLQVAAPAVEEAGGTNIEVSLPNTTGQAATNN
jgi:hypothetical protein